MSDIIPPPSDEPLPTPEENLAGVKANAVEWDAAIRAHPAYQAGGSDEAIAAAINADDRVGPDQPVPVSAIVNYLRREGVWLAIKMAASQGVVSAAAAVDLASDMHAGTVDLTLPIVRELLPDLVTRGLMKQAQLDMVFAMGKTVTPGWQALGAPSALNEHDIYRARAGA